MTTAPSDLAPVLLVYGLFLLIVIRRTIRLATGVRVSESRLVAMAGMYLFLFAITAGFDLVLLPIWSFAVDGAIIVIGALAATWHVERTVELYRGPGGAWFYRLGLGLPVLYLVLYVVRIAVDLVLIGTTPFAGPTGSSLNGNALLALGAVDALFALSAGLLVGRSIGVYRAYQRKLREAPTAPTVPPPAPPLPSGRP